MLMHKQATTALKPEARQRLLDIQVVQETTHTTAMHMRVQL